MVQQFYIFIFWWVLFLRGAKGSLLVSLSHLLLQGSESYEPLHPAQSLASLLFYSRQTVSKHPPQKISEKEVEGKTHILSLNAHDMMFTSTHPIITSLSDNVKCFNYITQWTKWPRYFQEIFRKRLDKTIRPIAWGWRNVKKKKSFPNWSLKTSEQWTDCPP